MECKKYNFSLVVNSEKRWNYISVSNDQKPISYVSLGQTNTLLQSKRPCLRQLFNMPESLPVHSIVWSDSMQHRDELIFIPVFCLDLGLLHNPSINAVGITPERERGREREWSCFLLGGGGGGGGEGGLFICRVSIRYTIHLRSSECNNFSKYANVLHMIVHLGSSIFMIRSYNQINIPRNP